MKIKMLILSLALALSMGSIFAISSPSLATAAAKDDICNGIGASGTACGGGGDLAKLMKNILNLFSIIIGVVAVFMMVYAGYQFNVSKGDGAKTAEARNTITYALVGLVVATLAQFLVLFVINTTTDSLQTEEQKKADEQKKAQQTRINNINVEYIASDVL